MSAEKVFYGPIDSEKPSRRQRAAGSRVFLAGVFGVAAVLTAAVVLAMVLNNISQQMARDHEEIMVLKASAQRDHKEIAILKANAERDREEIMSLKATAERDHEEIADLKATTEEVQLQNAFLMQRVAVLESQMLASRGEHQMPDTGSEQTLEAGDSGDAVAANAKVSSNNGTFLGDFK
ncbi:hypothetical protein Bbelb_268240 [Branchiostoma belcheri]|nr:hypothetical protein Bbelb_268240 [Branchiostoma belcheri]